MLSSWPAKEEVASNCLEHSNLDFHTNAKRNGMGLVLQDARNRALTVTSLSAYEIR
jgi:hypothetical protein